MLKDLNADQRGNRAGLNLNGIDFWGPGHSLLWGQFRATGDVQQLL